MIIVNEYYLTLFNAVVSQDSRLSSEIREHEEKLERLRKEYEATKVLFNLITKNEETTARALASLEQS